MKKFICYWSKENADLDDGESIERKLERIAMRIDSLKAQMDGKLF